MFGSSKSWGLNSTHLHGTHVPVEEPSTASIADIDHPLDPNIILGRPVSALKTWSRSRPSSVILRAGWLMRQRGSRAIRLTSAGRRGLREIFGMELADRRR